MYDNFSEVIRISQSYLQLFLIYKPSHHKILPYKPYSIQLEPKVALLFNIGLLHKKLCQKPLTASEKPCINMEFHAPLMHRYLTFHMQDSGQYLFNTDEASCLQLKLSIKQLTLELCRFGL